MSCTLCKQPIENYRPERHRLKLQNRAVDICPTCSQVFLEWQQRIYADLFPTRWAKKRFSKE